MITGFANFPTLEGNTIGLNAAGTAALPNATGVTVSVQADTVTIGGSTAGARNVISGNTGTGIFLNSAGGDGGVKILGNFIGTDATGTAKIGNAVGIDSKDSNGITIGQNSPNAGNVIAGSSGAGVHIEGDAAGNLVEGNFIGTDLTGALDLGNQGDGVHVGPLIHGTIVRQNTVEHNGGAGVAVPEPSTNTIVTQNSIDLNGGLGIDLGPTGVTANDGGDSDGFQNFPTLTSVSTTTVSGTLSSTGNLTYNVDLYLTPVCDPSGNGEGLTFLGTTTVSTDDGGSGSFTANVPALPAGQFVTATATNLDGGTSEFSACLSTVQPPIATNLTLTPSSGTTPAGAARVQLGNVPPSVFLQPQSTNQAAPVNDTPVNDTPVNDLPVNDLPVNDLPVNDLGFDDLAKNLPALGDTALSSIPLLRAGRLDEGALGRPGDAARRPAAAERHAARLLPARRPRARPEPGDAEHQPDRTDHAGRPRPHAQPARVAARERDRPREREAVVAAAARDLVHALRRDLLLDAEYDQPGQRPRRHDGHGGGDRGRSGQRHARQRHAGERSPG